MIFSVQFISKINKYLASWLLAIFFLSEAYGKYANLYIGDKSDIAKWIKFVILLFFSIACIKYKNSLKYLILLLVFFCVGQWLIDYGFQKEIIISFAKYIFPLFLFLYFNNYRQSNFSVNLLFKTFEIVILINSALIISGFFFEIPFLSTYRGDRFGYNGLFIASSTASYAYIIGLFYFLKKFKEDFVKKWQTYLTIAAIVLMGTKAGYLGLLGTLLIYFSFFTEISTKHKKTLWVVIIASSAALFYFFFFRYGIFNNIRQEEGLIAAVLSFRDNLFIEKMLPFIEANWNWVNYLFGGINDLATRSQMGVIDVFYFWGILGGIFYLALFFRTYITFYIEKADLFFLVTLMFIVFLAGNFFENASVAIYLLILRERLMINKTMK